MEILRCLVVEDDVLAIDMMADYIGRFPNLLLVGVIQELNDIPQAMAIEKPDVVFLDLVLPAGEPSDFHFGLFGKHVTVVVVSAIPTVSFAGIAPKAVAFELLKPVSFESFAKCIDHITNTPPTG